jgi:hypothetical protein
VDTFKYIFKVKAAEKNPKDISSVVGWSPYKAKDFLLNQGIKTGFYNKLFDQEWSASSHMESFGEGIMPDNIAYYLEGNEEVVNVLKIKVNVNDSARTQQALEKLTEMAESLSISSLSRSLSEKMKNAISQCQPYTEECESNTITLVVQKWPNHRFNGYDLKFIVSIS